MLLLLSYNINFQTYLLLKNMWKTVISYGWIYWDFH